MRLLTALLLLATISGVVLSAWLLGLGGLTALGTMWGLKGELGAKTPW